MNHPAPLDVGLLLFPGITALDFIGPAQVLASRPNTRLHHVWKTLEPVMSDVGLALTPTTRLADCPPLDVLVVAGGPGQTALMKDGPLLKWIATQGRAARCVASACTGSLLLAAAGLLDGRRAASHWAFRDLLAHFGATPDPARVVVDGPFVTGGGVTACLDMALRLLAELDGDEVAQDATLRLEYAPEPPFATGRPEGLPAAQVARVREALLKEAAMA
jgi:cyclohexyl-isocyanide hydratase